jgi:hypothetical protein
MNDIYYMVAMGYYQVGFGRYLVLIKIKTPGTFHPIEPILKKIHPT